MEPENHTAGTVKMSPGNPVVVEKMTKEEYETAMKTATRVLRFGGPKLPPEASDDDVVAPKKSRVAPDSKPGGWEQTGDLAAHSEQTWINLIAGANTETRKALTRKVAKMKAELAGPAASLTERLIVDEIALSWLEYHYANASCAEIADYHPKMAPHILSRKKDAERRYMAAIKELEAMRKLRSPGPKSAKARRSSPGPGQAEEPAGPLANLPTGPIELGPGDIQRGRPASS